MLSYLRTSFFVWLISIFFSPFVIAVQEVITPNVAGEKEQILFDILELALSKSSPSTKLIESSELLNEAQLMSKIESGDLDVMWSGTDQEKDQRMNPIRIPVLKGLLGHRIFLIRSADRARFANIDTFQDLLNYKAGQGTFWGDTQILKNANIPTVTTIKYKNLFPMLEGSRFDYFPRALHEPFIEVENHPDLDLVVDENIMLVYPYAMFFYVNKQNSELHSLIYTGLEASIQDGSYDALFFSNTMIQDVLTKANLSQRQVFRIENPFLHPDTPLDRAEFWLNINKLPLKP